MGLSYKFNIVSQLLQVIEEKSEKFKGEKLQGPGERTMTLVFEQ